MSDTSTSSDSQFLARVRQIVLEKFRTLADFERERHLVPGMMEREVLTGELPAEMIANMVVEATHCDRTWLMTGVGEPYRRKAPLPPSTPEPLPPQASPIVPSTAGSVGKSSGVTPPVAAAVASANTSSATATATATSETSAVQHGFSPVVSDPATTQPTPPNVPSNDGDPFNMVIGGGKTRLLTSSDTEKKDDFDDNFTVSKASDSGQLNPHDTFIVAADEIDGAETADRLLIRAMQIQRRNLRHPPELPGFEFDVWFQPARGAASEFYDFIKLDQNRWAILIVDVAGDDALRVWGDVMMAWRTLRILAKTCKTPREVLIRTNDELVPDLEAAANMTVFYSVLDVEARTLVMAQSGHRPLLLCNPYREPDPLMEIKPSGMVLGLVTGKKFDDILEERVLTLRPGDLLLWYTEGIELTTDTKGRELGIDGLRILLQRHGDRAAKSFIKDFQKRVENYRGGQPQVGDYTAVALKVGMPANMA